MLGNGLIILLTGYLEQHYANAQSMVLHHDFRWTCNGFLNGLQLFCYAKKSVNETVVQRRKNFSTVLLVFQKKKQISLVLALFLLFWAGRISTS
jgi:hypothetical protein